MKLANAGKAFGYWNKKDNTFQFKLPPGTCKAEISFMGVSGIYEFYFSKNTIEASRVSWEDYDYDYKSEAYMLDREFTKHGRHPPIVERPIPRVEENMSEFYNPTRPSHLINGSLVRKRRVYAPHELRPARRVGGTMGMTRVLPTSLEVDLVLLEGLDLILDPLAKLLKEEDPTQNYHLGHLLDVLVLGPALGQDLLLILGVDLDPHPIVSPPHGMMPIVLHGKDYLHKSLHIRKIFGEM